MTCFLIQRIADVLHFIDESGNGKFDTDHPLDHGILDSRCGRGCVPFMEGSNVVNNSEAVKEVIEGDKIRSFFKNLLEDEVLTFDYKWLRGIYRVRM